MAVEKGNKRLLGNCDSGSQNNHSLPFGFDLNALRNAVETTMNLLHKSKDTAITTDYASSSSVVSSSSAFSSCSSSSPSSSSHHILRATANLFEQTDIRWISLRFLLQFVYTQPKSKPLKIQLHHSLNHENTDVCLIVPDPQTKWKDEIAKQKVSSVQKVVGLEQLRKKYSSISAKKRLRKAFDVFFCDASVAHLMPQILGREFIEFAKLPISVHLRLANVKDSLTAAMQCTFCRIKAGNEIVVKVGRSDMEMDEIVENAEKVISNVYSFLRTSEAWSNEVIRIALQMTTFKALPFYSNPSLGAAVKFYDSVEERVPC